MRQLGVATRPEEYRMRFLDLTLLTIADNLALDEALLLEAEASRSGEVLRLWEWPSPAVVLGAGCRLADDVNEDVCQTDAVPIMRRASGGGTVLLGLGCLNFTLILAYDRAALLREIGSSYCFILNLIVPALADLQPPIELAGISDLACGGRKLSGNAQQRKRNYLLHHGTLLYDFHIDQMSRYLKLPARQPDYRGQRPHSDFVMNLPATAGDLKQHLRTAWNAHEELESWPQETAQRLVAEKYQNPEWIRRR